MRPRIGLLAALMGGILLLVQSAGAAVAAETTLRPGASYVFELRGNPSTGYVWRLNKAKSENPAIVRVEDLGYGEASKKRYGAPSSYRFRITGRELGVARLRFEYLRPWVGSPSKSENLWVRVK